MKSIKINLEISFNDIPDSKDITLEQFSRVLEIAKVLEPFAEKFKIGGKGSIEYSSDNIAKFTFKRGIATVTKPAIYIKDGL